jgi:tricorn protease
MNDLYRFPSTGGTPTAIAADRYADESEASPNPANDTIAFVSSSMARNQWWRRGHAHIDESRIALLTPARSRDSAPAYQPLIDNYAKNLWPTWSPDGKVLFFMSDKSGTENIWRMTPGAAPKQVTNFTDGRVLWPAIAADGKAIVFEREFRIWKLDLSSGRAAWWSICAITMAASSTRTRWTYSRAVRI